VSDRVTVNHQRHGGVRDGRTDIDPRTLTSDLSATDLLFAMLDGQIIRGRNEAWRAEVVSILAKRGETWVQIGPAERPARSVLLRMTSERCADLAIEALRAWTDLPAASRPTLIEVDGVERP